MTTNEREAFEKRLAHMLRTCLHVYAEGVRPEGGLDRWENYMQKVRDTNNAARALLAEYDRTAIDQRQEVTDEMVELAAIAMAEINGDDPHQLLWEGSPPELWGEVRHRYEKYARIILEAALQPIARPVKVPAKKEPNGDVYIHGWNNCVEAFLAANPWYTP